MPSNEYSGIPAVCRLHLTGKEPIDLLNANGLCITYPNGWVPKVAQLKGGGVKVESQSMDDDWLVAGGYETVEESLPLQVDPNFLAHRIENLERTLWEAEQYWISGWQRGAAYLAVQLKEEDHLRYARVKRGSYQLGQYAFGRRTGLPENTLLLEREPFWHDNPPNEITGPFTNWIPNPSFEYWRDEGLANARPSGWYTVGTEPTGGYISREDAKIAGPSYAAKLGFASWVGGANSWGLRSQTSWPGSTTTHTLRFWLKVTGASANAVVRIILRDSTLTARLTLTYNADFVGWVYEDVDVPLDGAGFYIIEASWLFPAAAVATPGEFVIDRMILTRGTWTEDTWPGDFYMGCSTVYGWEDDEDCYTPKNTNVENWHFINHMDIEGVPGDVEAPALITVERLGAEYGYDYNWPLVDYWLCQRRIEPDVLNPRDGEHISLNVDPEGYTGADNSYAGVDTASETAVAVLLRQTYGWHAAVGFRADGITETEPYVGQYRVLMRARFAPDEGTPDAEARLVYWIGNPANEITLEEITIPTSSTFRLYNLTPLDLMDWQPYRDRPVSLGFKIELYNAGSSGLSDYFWIDDIQLVSTEGGLVHVEFDASTPWWTGQALILDGDEQTVMPVAIGSPGTDDWILESDFARVAGTDMSIMDSQTYNGVLYVVGYDSVAVVNHLYQFDEGGWALKFNLTGEDPIFSVLETYDGKLFLAGSSIAGEKLYYWQDGWPSVINACNPVGTEIQDLHGFNGFLYAATDVALFAINVKSAIEPGCYTQINYPAAFNRVCLEVYKRKLYMAVQNGRVFVYDPINGMVDLGQPTGAANPWYAIREWNDLLYVYGTGGLYSYDGNTWTLRLAAGAGTECYLQVYDGALFVAESDPAGGAGGLTKIYKTTDGVTFTLVWQWTSKALVGAMAPYDGRLYVAQGVPRWMLGGSYYANSKALWHQTAPAKLYTPNYTGGAFMLRPDERQRFYQRMEAKNMTTSSLVSYLVRPNASLTSTKGPQTQFSIAFDSRWRSLRGE